MIRRSLVLLTLVTLTLAACSTPVDAGDASRAPTTSASSKPTPTATAAPTGSATGAPPDASPTFEPTPPEAPDDKMDFSDWAITGEGIGPVKLGMSQDELAVVLTEFDGYGSCGQIVWTGHVILLRTYQDEMGRVTAVSLEEAVYATHAPRTAEGLTLTTPEATVQAQYPGVALETSSTRGTHYPVPAGDNVIDFSTYSGTAVRAITVHTPTWAPPTTCPV